MLGNGLSFTDILAVTLLAEQLFGATGVLMMAWIAVLHRRSATRRSARAVLRLLLRSKTGRQK